MSRIPSRALPALTAAALVALGSGAVRHAVAAELTLAEAEGIALSEDPSVLAIEARRVAFQERAKAAGELPDPMLKMGLVSLPTDTFDFDQEPMTQAQLGLSQKFPRGDTRSLRSEQFLELADGMGHAEGNQRLQIVHDVRIEFLEAVKQRRLAAINREAIRVFGDLADITRDYYATGRVHQQDVLRAAVELARVEDRGQSIAEAEDAARARLAAWLGEAAWREVSDDWPEIPNPDGAESIKNALPRHPRIRALQQDVIAAETGIELARQAYKPEIALDFTYGARSGRNPDGMPRADFVSLMLVMDLPLFHANRQDRETAARVAESSAVMYARDDVYRRLRSQVDLHFATLRQQRERLALFESRLLPEADFNAEAAFEAYRAAVADLTTLMRARIIEYDLQLEYEGLLAEELKARTRLLYLQGEPQ